jgi:hypothetical protein
VRAISVDSFMTSPILPVVLSVVGAFFVTSTARSATVSIYRVAPPILNKT